MSYFPAFIKLETTKILIVGGGAIAYEKLEKLLDFTDDITVISQDLSEQMKEKVLEYGLSYEVRPYKEGDVNGFDIVIIAVDDIPLQARIYEETRSIRCLCNAVDSVAYCDFIFPSYIKEDDLTIAISTSGTSPAFAKHFKHYLKTCIPEGVCAFLKEMKDLRSRLPKGKERMKILDEKVQAYMKEWNN